MTEINLFAQLCQEGISDSVPDKIPGFAFHAGYSEQPPRALVLCPYRLAESMSPISAKV